MIIQKSAKGNPVVIAERQDYIKQMNNILSDQKKICHDKYEDFIEFCCQTRKTRWQRSQKNCWVK